MKKKLLLFFSFLFVALCHLDGKFIQVLVALLSSPPACSIYFSYSLDWSIASYSSALFNSSLCCFLHLLLLNLSFLLAGLIDYVLLFSFVQLFVELLSSLELVIAIFKALRSSCATVNKDSSNRCGNQSASAFVSAMPMGNRFYRMQTYNLMINSTMVFALERV